MTIPYIKGWGDTLKENLPQIGQGIRDIKDPNWRRNEKIEEDLLDTTKLQNYANLYHANPQAFTPETIGKKNVSRIREMTQDPDFVLKRSEAAAKQTFMQNPENAKQYAEIMQTGSDGVTKQLRVAELEARHLRNTQERELRNSFLAATPEEQARLLKNQNYRERTGFNEAQFGQMEAEAKDANELRAAITSGKEWVAKNKKIITNPEALANAIRGGAMDPATYGALMNDPQYKPVMALASQMLSGAIDQEYALARQAEGIAASEESQGRMFKQQDKRDQERLANAGKAKSQYILRNIADQLFKAKDLSATDLESSIMPVIQDQLREWAEINGKPMPILSVEGKTEMTSPTTWGWNGKPRIVYRNADGEPETLLPNTDFNAISPSAPKEERDNSDLSQLDQGLLQSLKDSNPTEINNFYMGATPATKAKLDQWMTEGRIPDMRQPGGK